MIICGIDPGSSGGIAYNEPGKGIQAVKMPPTERALVSLIRDIRDAYDDEIRVFIEQVTGYVKPAKDEEERENRQPGHTMFKFGRGVGVIVGALLALGIEPVEVAPRVWQKPFFIPKGKKSDRKRAMKDRAQRRYPQIKVTLATADALLIRAYGEMQLGVTLPAIERKPESATSLPAMPQTQESSSGAKKAEPFRDDLAEPFVELKRTVSAVPVAGKYVEANGYRIIEFPDGTARPATREEITAGRVL